MMIMVLTKMINKYYYYYYYYYLFIYFHLFIINIILSSSSSLSTPLYQQNHNHRHVNIIGIIRFILHNARVVFPTVLEIRQACVHQAVSLGLRRPGPHIVV